MKILWCFEISLKVIEGKKKLKYVKVCALYTCS